MARKWKTYQTSLGFFDLAIAAPSMKAALEAWGADSNLFHQGAAKESDNPDVISAATKRPGVVLKRPSDPSANMPNCAPILAVAETPAKNRPKVGRPQDEKAFLPPRGQGGGAEVRSPTNGTRNGPSKRRK